jgi:hypothetical protein
MRQCYQPRACVEEGHRDGRETMWVTVSARFAEWIFFDGSTVVGMDLIETLRDTNTTCPCRSAWSSLDA